MCLYLYPKILLQFLRNSLEKKSEREFTARSCVYLCNCYMQLIMFTIKKGNLFSPHGSSGEKEREAKRKERQGETLNHVL
jgi:hypothetical protein